MTTANEYERQQDLRATLVDGVLDLLGPGVLADPTAADIVNRVVDRQLALSSTPGSAGSNGVNGVKRAGDDGFGDLVGIGSSASGLLGDMQVTPEVIAYDDVLKSERILSAADLYYLYVHESLGVFRAVWKLQELFRAGTLRISNGPGAFALYRFDKRAVLRYKTRERLTAYRRVLGYTNAPPGANARANAEFHGLFTHFIGETAKYWRDKRISDVIRERANDPTFGSVAIVRRAGLDLRNNLKNSSYGWINVLRIESLQALSEAFKILSAEDIRAQFGAETPWDTTELIMWQYFGEAIAASSMNRMAVSGRKVLQWLAEPYVLNTDRREFETSLYQIAEAAEEWISSDEGMRLSRPTPPARQVYQPGPPPRGTLRQPMVVGRPPAPPAAMRPRTAVPRRQPTGWRQPIFRRAAVPTRPVF